MAGGDYIPKMSELQAEYDEVVKMYSEELNDAREQLRKNRACCKNLDIVLNVMAKMNKPTRRPRMDLVDRRTGTRFA